MIAKPLRWGKRLAERTPRLQRLNIGSRLTLCFVLIILAMLAGNSILLWQFHQARKEAERLAGVDQELIIVLQAHTNLMSLYEKLNMLADSEDSTLLLEQVEAFHNALLQDSERGRNALAHLPPEVQLDPTLLPSLLAIYRELPAQLEAITILAKTGEWNAVRLRLTNQVRPLESRSSTLVENIDRDVSTQRMQAVQNIQQAQRRILLVVSITAAVTLLFAAILGLLITRSITQPLGRLVEGSTALARGDFSHRVATAGNDEIMRLGSVFNDMIVRLQELYRELQSRETYLAEAQKLSHTGSFGWNLETGEIYWSAETFRIFDFAPKAKVTVDSILGRTHPQDRAALREALDRISLERFPFDVQHRLLMPDGSVKYLRVVGRPSIEKSGHPEFVGAVTDISEQKRAQEAVQRSECELRDVIESVPTFAWTARPDGSVDFANRSWREYTGLSAEATNGSGWQAAVHVEDLEPHLEKWQISLTTNQRFENEVRFRRAGDGRFRWFLTRAVPLRNDQGNILKWYGIATDIEDRKQAEQALRRSEAYLAESQRFTKTGSWAFAPSTGQTTYWSGEMFRILDLDPRQAPAHKTFWELAHHEDCDRVMYHRDRSFAEKSEYVDDYRAAMPDGTVKHFHVIGHPVLDESGQVFEYVGTVVDVTDRKRAEEERDRLHQLETDLAHIHRVSMMGELAASLAHEIKQPITAAATNAATCLRWLQHDPPQIAEAHQTAARAVRDLTRAAEIIDRLRSLYTKGVKQRELVDVNEVVGEITVLLHNEAYRYSILIRNELADHVPKIIADRVQIQQALMNLMLNGIEAMRDTGGELLIKSGRISDGQLLISVRDTGVGLPDEMGDQIFSAFYTTKSQGTGMGLAITRSIVESHGGRLWAESNRGPGATFHFTLSVQG